MPLSAEQKSFLLKQLEHAAGLDIFTHDSPATIRDNIGEVLAPQTRSCGDSGYLADYPTFRNHSSSLFTNERFPELNEKQYLEFLRLTETRYHMKFYLTAEACSVANSGGGSTVIVISNGNGKSTLVTGSGDDETNGASSGDADANETSGGQFLQTPVSDEEYQAFLDRRYDEVETIQRDPDLTEEDRQKKLDQKYRVIQKYEEAGGMKKLTCPNGEVAVGPSGTDISNGCE